MRLLNSLSQNALMMYRNANLLCFLQLYWINLLVLPFFWGGRGMDPFSSVQLRLTLCDESQHTRPPSPSSFPRVHSNWHPSSWWYHPAISSSVIPSSSCPQSLPASESFPMSQVFAWGSQSIRVWALASFLPNWSPLEWTGWVSLQSKGLSRVFSNTTVQKHEFFGAHGPTLRVS